MDVAAPGCDVTFDVGVEPQNGHCHVRVGGKTEIVHWVRSTLAGPQTKMLLGCACLKRAGGLPTIYER